MALELLSSPHSSEDVFTGVLLDEDGESSSYSLIEPLATAFSAVSDDWKHDLPHLKACCDDFFKLKAEFESEVQSIQTTFLQLQHTAVADEVAICQAWCELEELCIIESAIHHRRGLIDDRWIRELAYRRLVVVEANRKKIELQSILDDAGELEEHSKSRMHEIMLQFLPKHRRLFLRTKEHFDPAMDALEMGVVTRAGIEKEVEMDATPMRDDETEEFAPTQSSGHRAFPGSPSRPLVEGITWKEHSVLEAEQSKLGALLESCHIYEVQIVSFRVELNTWVTAFCVVTHQHYMHFPPLLPGTEFETLKKGERSALTAACVAALEKGSTPLLSVLLRSCSYDLSSDGSFIELVITYASKEKDWIARGIPT
ncbi:hypothetical protein ACA910_004883 [Epithemia clementina (nom. ined.)]